MILNLSVSAQKPAKLDISRISIYLVVVLYRHDHSSCQKVKLDIACRGRTTTKFTNYLKVKLKISKTIENVNFLKYSITFSLIIIIF
jgi:hypothetical protein